MQPLVALLFSIYLAGDGLWSNLQRRGYQGDESKEGAAFQWLVFKGFCAVNHSLYATGKQWFDPSQFHLTISRTKESVTGKSFISIGVHFHSFSPAHLVSLSI